MELLNIDLNICSVKGCGRKLHAKTFCRRHYQRNKEYGRLDKIVTGDKSKHPLFKIWNSARRRKAFCDDWHNDFYKFVTDVGEKPENSFLDRLNESLPCGPTNFRWKVFLKRQPNETNAERLKRVKKEAVKLNPNYHREKNYKYNFGLTIDDYNAKLEAQNFVCEICKEPETSINFRTGEIKFLAVDHCHNSNKLRGLLCWRCNGTLGRVKDSIDILQSMINYLKKYSNGNDS